jgi:MFS family permease
MATATRSSALVPRLNRHAWTLLLANCFSNLGSGLVLPFLIVYLHRVRGIDLGRAGLTLSLIGFAGIVATPFAGALADRIGARRTFAVGLVLFAVATPGFIPVSTFPEALAPAFVYGVAGGLTWSGLYALLGGIVAPEERADAFGISYALANVGIGAGALIAGFAIDVDSPHSFVVLFVADAVSDLLFAGVLLSMGERRQPAAEPDPQTDPPVADPPPQRSYRGVLADRALLGTFALNVLLVTIGTAQLTSAFPAWATGPAKAGTSTVGAAFAANTAVIVVAQLFVLRVVRRTRRTRAAGTAGLIFGLAWLIVLAGGHTGGGTAAAVAFIAALGIFGLGETFLSPSLPAIVNDIAPDELRGRYNAVFTLSWQIGPVIGPALAGAALGHGRGDAYLVALAAACGGCALLVRLLARIVPTKADVPSLA